MEQKEFFEFIQKLEGFKVRFKELHWNAFSNAEHLLVDKILSEISEFQDNFAETGFTVFGKFPAGTFVALTDLIVSENTKDALQELLSTMFEAKESLTSQPNLCDFSALCDEGISFTRRLIYLADQV